MLKNTVMMLALLVAGCAAPGQVGPVDAAKIKSVIVIGAIPNELIVENAGVNQSMPIDWDVGRIARDQVMQALRGRYEVRPFSEDDGAFRGVVDPPVRFPKLMTERLQAVVAPGSADAILVASGTESARVIIGSRLEFIQIGYWLTLYDGKTREPVARAWVGLPCARVLCLDGFEQPTADLPFKWPSESHDELPKQRRDQIRSSLADLIGRSMPNTLARLRLIPETP
jgi:hypothetical protein